MDSRERAVILSKIAKLKNARNSLEGMNSIFAEVNSLLAEHFECNLKQLSPFITRINLMRDLRSQVIFLLHHYERNLGFSLQGKEQEPFPSDSLNERIDNFIKKVNFSLKEEIKEDKDEK